MELEMDIDADVGGATTDDAAADGTPPADDLHDLERVRELILQAHPDVVPELISGATIDELLGSVASAQDAFTRVSERLAANSPAAPRIPAGNPVRTTSVNADSLSPVSKIRMGLGGGE